MVNITETLETENIDVIESESEDTDFEERSARGVPSRTPEII